jgi:hypothetical protein
MGRTRPGTIAAPPRPLNGCQGLRACPTGLPQPPRLALLPAGPPPPRDPREADLSADDAAAYDCRMARRFPTAWRLVFCGPTAVACGLLATGCDIRDEVVEPARATADRLLRAEALVSGGMLGAAAGGPALPRDSIEFVEGYADALARATSESKPLLVVCRATWCRWSADFARGVLANPQIVALSRQFVCVMLDADRHADACKTLGVTAFPTVMVLGSDGTERTRTVGRPTLQALVSVMESGLHATVAADIR